jgi:hypothetical protein
MPYKIEKSDKGFFVVDPKTHHKFSKRGLTLKKAQAQRTAIILSEHPNKKNLSKYYL